MTDLARLDPARTVIRVALPPVHMAGCDAHYKAHLEVGQHGLAVFLSPHADAPLLDIDGTPEQLHGLLEELQAALAALHTPAPGAL